MSQSDDKIVYPKLQGAINYWLWKQNMILLFKKERAYEIATRQALKPAEPVYSPDLTKLQFRERLRAAQAASSATSKTITSQSGESATTAPPAPPPVIPNLSRD